MTVAEMTARALQRGADERIHICRIRGRDGCYTARSRTTPGERYFLVAQDGAFACSCPGFYYRQVCKHSQRLLSRLAREGKEIPQG